TPSVCPRSVTARSCRSVVKPLSSATRATGARTSCPRRSRPRPLRARGRRPQRTGAQTLNCDRRPAMLRAAARLMRATRRHALLSIALAGAIAGCATQADIQELEREQRLIRSQLADTRASLETLERDVAKVRGGVDEVRHTTRGRGTIPSRVDDLEA